jgi:predicted nuclease of predicted toxin-antitoxin system
MTLRLLLDEDMSYRVAEGLRRRQIDAVSVGEVGRASKGISDADQLAYAVEQERVLVTYNRADFQALDDQWRAMGRAHFGIIWCSERSIPRRSIGDLVHALSAIASERSSLQALCLPLAGNTRR